MYTDEFWADQPAECKNIEKYGGKLLEMIVSTPATSPGVDSLSGTFTQACRELVDWMSPPDAQRTSEAIASYLKSPATEGHIRYLENIHGNGSTRDRLEFVSKMALLYLALRIPYGGGLQIEDWIIRRNTLLATIKTRLQ